ncbi:MAG: PASTA domain-containing protein [Microthrixaceae bacterium]
MKSALAESPVLPLISADDVPIPTTTVPSPNATVTDAVKATEMALVPNVVGASPESARKKLTGEGFKVRELRNEVVDLASSTVTAQSPVRDRRCPKAPKFGSSFCPTTATDDHDDIYVDCAGRSHNVDHHDQAQGVRLGL